MKKLNMSKSILILQGPEYAQQHLDPNKSFYEDVTLSQVISILESKDALWGVDSGGASLGWCTKEEYEGQNCYVPIPDRPSLVILYNNEFGFHFRFDINGEQFIAITPGVESCQVVQQICGQPAYFPSASFVSLDVAHEVVTSFVKTSKRYSQLQWIESSAFRYDRPNEWRKLIPQKSD